MTRLEEAVLYLGDNGRVTCGRLACAGSSSWYTGRDLSGQPLVRLDAEQWVAQVGSPPQCETCGALPAPAGGSFGFAADERICWCVGGVIHHGYVVARAEEGARGRDRILRARDLQGRPWLLSADLVSHGWLLEAVT